MRNRHAHLLVSVIATSSLLTTSAAIAAESSTRSTDWRQKAQEVARNRLIQGADADKTPCGTGVSPVLHRRDAGATQTFSETPRFELVQASTRPAAETQPTKTENPPAETQPLPSRGPLPGFGETIERDVKELPSLFWHDTKKVFGDPYNLVFLLGAGGVSAALRPEVDDDIEDHYDHHHTFRDAWPDTFGALGNPAAHFGFALAWYALGQQAQDAKTYEVGKRAIDALAITGITTMLLKFATYTDSPNGEALGWPSGHVSSTMALATVLNDAYGPLVGVPMFGLTGLVAVERMDDGEHHFSDVVFGAALGWVVAETIMKDHRPEIFGGDVVPYADLESGNAGVAWVKTFKP